MALSERAKQRALNREKGLCFCGRKRASGREICTMCIQRYDRRRSKRKAKSKGNRVQRVGPLTYDSYGLLPADGLGRLSSEDY